MSAEGQHLTISQIIDYSSGRNEMEGADLHLVSCNECWAAVQADRQGRMAAESLREVAPPQVRDRVAVSTRLARPSAPSRSKRTWLTAAAAVVAAALLSGSIFAAVNRSGHPPDSKIVKDLVQAASIRSISPASSVTGTSGQVASLSAMEVRGVKVVVARSTQVFAMPYKAVALTPAGAPWMAVRGPVTLVCLDSPRPIILAAELPADVLMPLAHQLDTTS